MSTFLLIAMIFSSLCLALYGTDQKQKHISTTPKQKENEEYFDLEKSKHYKKSLYSLFASNILFLAWIIISHITLGASLVVGLLCYIANIASIYGMELQMKSLTAKKEKQKVAGIIVKLFLGAAIIWVMARIFIS